MFKEKRFECQHARRMVQDRCEWREFEGKCLDEIIDEGVLRCFCHLERMESNRIAKRVYVEDCTDSRSVGMPWKRWIDNVKECLRKRSLDVRQARRMMQDRSEWWGMNGA